ncbi:hypothetical protein V493_06876 [Pseudogymnoascus sp. VKM F-4281 (FW-2241)]|nr:hypothetical protein V493_06876 [Pseudogymnoascus sp. VKM F-4281 (FW-2241)]
MSESSIPSRNEPKRATGLGTQQSPREPSPDSPEIIAGTKLSNATITAATNIIDGRLGAEATQTGTPITAAAQEEADSREKAAAAAAAATGTVPGGNTAPYEMTLADLDKADPNTRVPLDIAAKLILGTTLPIPPANPVPRSSSSSDPPSSTKRSATTDNFTSTKRQRTARFIGNQLPPDDTNDLTTISPVFPDPVVTQTPFAPPYQSIFLRQNPDLASALAHVNCSYLTTHDVADPYDLDSRANTAPTLAELKAHARSLLLVIRSMSISSRASLADNASLHSSTEDCQDPAPLAPEFFSSTDAFDFLNDLASSYRSRDPAENEPLTTLINQLITHPDPSRQIPASTEACPLATVKLITEGSDPAYFRPGVNPLPHSQINRLMAHADELLLQIDAALSPSGGFLAALPLDLPASDPRRQTYIGQLIHFMRVLVGRLHVLDRDYGQALGLLAGEATIPAELKLNIEHQGQIEAPLVTAQHKFIINTDSDTYTRIWAHLRSSASDKAVRTSGMGLLDVVLTTRYRALRGGKTIFVTPIPDDPTASQVVGRPTVVACAQPGFGTRTSEWERKKGAALREAEELRERAEMAERQVEILKGDVKALIPEGVWANGEKEDVLTMWGKVQAERDAMADERKQMELFKSRCRVLEKKNTEMGMEFVKKMEKIKKTRSEVEEGQREEIRKLLREGRTTSAGEDGADGAETEELKEQVIALQAQLVEAKSESGSSKEELEASRVEVTKLREEVEELKGWVQVQRKEGKGKGREEESEKEKGEEGEDEESEEVSEEDGEVA